MSSQEEKEQEEVVRLLLTYSPREDAEKIINLYYPSKTTREKVELLKNMFDIPVDEHEPIEQAYSKILDKITKTRRY